MLVSKMQIITQEKCEKNKNASESTHSVIRPLVIILCKKSGNFLSFFLNFYIFNFYIS